MSMIRDVEKFHQAYGVADAEWPPSKELMDLRESLIVEEWEEYLAAVSVVRLQPNLNADVQVADALADLAYVVIGTMISYFGAETAERVWAEVQRSNMSKFGEDGKPVYREDGKVLKGPNFSPPDLEKALRPCPDCNNTGRVPDNNDFIDCRCTEKGKP
jgi:predicted HAD superfamily Cof-like phosphohydrolase